MTLRHSISARSLLLASCISVTMGLTACGSLNSLGDVPEFLNSDLDTAPPREFITEKDVAKIKAGMTPLEVRNRLGPPLLFDESTYARFDQFSLFNIFPRTDKRPNNPMVYNYVLRDMSSGKAQFLPFAVNFQKTRTLGVFTSIGVKNFGIMEKPTIAKFETPATMAAEAPVAATPSAIPESEPVVAAAVAPAMPVTATGMDTAAATDDIIKSVQAWAQAWASKDADSYISYYTADFDGGMGRAKWEKQRRQRLSNPQSITLSLSDIRITPRSDTVADVSFRQEYSSNMFKENGRKTLTMTRAGGSWKIRNETFKK